MRCTICNHERLAQIELALVHGVSAATIARRFDCSPDAVARHRQKHLTAQAKAAILLAVKPSEIDLEALQRSESEGLLAQLITQRARLAQLTDLALQLGDIKGAAAVEARMTANLDLSARLLGQLTIKHEVKHTSFLISADYVELRRVITQALRPHAEASRDVALALARLETETAENMVRSGDKPLLTAETLHDPPPVSRTTEKV